ncbi:lysoplasmalogenase [Cellulomonas composti]|uniref:Lysoplasmalogenase n=1 Tax=Cellulomonas composti TaxID=266130 RepID=A0A511J730_9CELL|nr:lysoplasmalogenase [Cellulomonas composti]GEL93788.1 hypothetical protein CCO02nite_04460 [Cellulomonas composti]
MLRPPPWVLRASAVAYVVVTLTHLTALVVDADALADVSQWLLMPTLAVVLLAATRWPRGRLVAWSLVALGFSFLGDFLPSRLSGDAAFLAMVGCFLLAQASYVVAFAPLSGRSVARRRPLLVLPYTVVLVALVGFCASHAGSMLVPVAVYGGVLTAMAVLATGLGTVGAVGGAVFLVSDGLIALERFVPGWELPGQSVWVMATYALGQALLVVAVVRVNRSSRRAPEAPAPATTSRAPKRDNVVALVAHPGGLPA